MPSFISEDQIEQALVQKLQHLHGFDSLDCHTEDPEDLNDGSGRANKRDVILVDRVREAATRLNPRIPQTTQYQRECRQTQIRFSLTAARGEEEKIHTLTISVAWIDDTTKG